ncbi:unnamed protein product [Clonostachys byssicola]|uniref:Uncharacterized protein n=1 Tax=Clonostachys byssicola TaxID=160290 RepID=A0A9N9Y412_9HYPO|nr:unnamed protein product [Clonostachys byssicola]
MNQECERPTFEGQLDDEGRPTHIPEIVGSVEPFKIAAVDLADFCRVACRPLFSATPNVMPSD